MRSIKHRTKKSRIRSRLHKSRRAGTRKRARVSKRTKSMKGCRRVKRRGRGTSYKRNGGTADKSPRQQLLEMAKDAEEVGNRSAARRFREMTEDLPVTPGNTPVSTPPTTPVRTKKDSVMEESPHSRKLRRAEEGVATPPRIFIPYKGPTFPSVSGTGKR